MNLKLTIPVAFLVVAVFIQAASAQTCPNTNPDTDSQLGCPDPFYTQISRPVKSGGIIEFNITVNNRKIVFPPDCAPGEQSCFDNVNYQGLPMCQSWSGNFTDVKVELSSCYPSCRLQGCPNCDFNITINPSKPQAISNEKSQNYIIRIESFRTSGDYDFTFSAFQSSVKKRIFSLRLNISTQPFGTEGDNAMCVDCSSRKCDTEETACRSSCPAAIYCTAPGCSFDTPYSDAAQSCCGDDSGEIFKKCLKSADIQWRCPTAASCCGDRGNCAYDRKCYSEGKAYLLAVGEDQNAYCYQGAWHDCDEGPSICSGCGFLWNNSTSACCGDDSDEYYKARMCFSGCDTNLTDKSCCSLGSECVYQGQCYATEAVIVLGKKNVTCAGGVWYEKTNQSECYKGTCNNNDKCDGSCPGCIFKDYSCYGTNCEADFIDPDMHWTYCANCSLNWSFPEKQCCGDDQKEFWVPPCPNVNASWTCCSNPSERVNARGECVISCGVGMVTNLTEFSEGMIPFSFSLSSDVIDVGAGRTAEFKVTVRTDGSRPLHNIRLDLCGPFSFEASPRSIEELRPGEPRDFTVKLITPLDSTAGAQEFAVYVSSSELIRQRYKLGMANVTVADYSYDIYLAIAATVAAIYIAKKLLSRRRERPAGKPAGKAAPEKGERKGSREAARSKLAQIVREQLGKGADENDVREMLASHGIEGKDIEAAFKEAKKR